jgi:hypothetical protein
LRHVEEKRVNKFGIGQPVPRLEDPRFITGRGRFVDDIELPRQCHGIVVMSTHAHATLLPRCSGRGCDSEDGHGQ